jgi:hypothetical protein
MLRRFPALSAVFVAAVTSTACGGPSEPPVVAPPPPEAPAPSPVAVAISSLPPVAVDAGASAPPPTAPAQLASTAVAIPGATSPVSFDYLSIDRAKGRVYLAVGGTGSLDVFDIGAGTFTRVDGFKTTEREYHGKKRMTGPSASAVGDGVVYVGDRLGEVCTVDDRTLKLGACLTLASPPDGVAYVASAKEVWVTTPRDQSLTILDASKPGALKAKTVIKIGADVEGYAIDETHGLFFTNTEDKGTTLAVDVKTRKVRSTWKPGCDSDGPRGVAVDPARGFLFVACTDHVQVLDAAHDGALLGRFETGAGVDNLDYEGASGLLVAAAGKAGQITIAKLDDKGNPTIVASGPTAAGARNAVLDAKGNAYVPDPSGATLLVLTPR